MKSKEQQALLLIVKNALEYNASVIRYAAMICGTELTKDGYKKAREDFIEMGRDYSKVLQKTVEDIFKEQS